ncbi:MAG TPA: NAD(P)/FAD-dependent oxidoreductase [Methanospirillum sp.]|uniref:NAD(P)/FAD-dependent oxidoreductase n=1 Tax=Methanospirillum sp. TaxID=45200 RepID=UPI002CFCAB88|nr:NAD(P)/FAD-dependent oxidoreductase [Methanospirillum sp.]HWQ65147.1 NAD(P)/FAD-dependent oxidoreductase [Methanospirillum sp.]
MRIGIIGGGLAGLVAGYSLAEVHDVVIFEQESELGGLLSSYRVGNYSIERFYHHFFSGDTTLMTLLDELGLSSEIIWLSGSTGSYTDGAIHPLTTPFEILRYPYLSLVEKARLGLFTKQASHMDMAPLDAISAHDFIISNLGERIYHSFFEPLLKSKFGQNSDLVSAAWLISRVAIRSNRGVAGERLGYIKGGFSAFIDRLSDAARNNGCTIRTEVPVTSVIQVNASTQPGWKINDEFFDLVIGTVSPRILQSLGVPDIPSIPYQGAACLTLALSRDVTNGTYWLNITDPAPYGAVVSHTNFAPFEWYGEHLVYLASYFSGEPEPALKEKMLSDFCTKFSVDPSEIHWSRIAIDRDAGPLYLTGYRDHLTDPAVSGLYLAGMFSPENYPERSIEGSVKAARRVVEGIQNRE